MARKIILETGYSFVASTRTIVIPRYIARERLVLITNVTTNQVIYNFSDPALRATSYTATVSGATGSTTIVLSFNTVAMSNTDKLQFTVDEFAEAFEPAETILDPNNKMRVTEPQALIDTDFEYGTQITKWENLSTINQRPSFATSATPIPNITNITMSAGSKTVTVTTSSAHGLTVGTPVSVSDSFLILANGNFVIESVTTSTPFTFTYTASSQNTTSITELFDTNKTIVAVGSLYTGAQIGAAPTAMTYNATTGAVTVTTSVPHGLSLGNEIFITGVTTSGSNPPNGTNFVSTIISPTQFVYYFINATISGTLTFSSAGIYMRPQGSINHRPFDGGVLFTNGANSNNQMTARQTRRYFRYQSGKGLQASSGTILKPNFQIDSLTSSGTTVTVQTKERHGLQPGATIIVSGATETAYNGTFTITSILSVNRFTYIAGSAPSASPASGLYNVAINTWTGSTNRLGIFDQQNGMFWEFDGTTLSAVRRSSTFQISGRITATAGSSTITQTDATYPTVFSKQLVAGDFIVIRGQSYRIQHVASDTSATISPAYRGTTASFVVASKTIDTKVAQSAFNIDRIDGTGPSGYNIDLTKMQMFYIDYTWYGAGFIRYGIRGPNGNVIYVHKVPNNNVNTEAYMRSGNLPARYETATMAVSTTTTSTVNGSDVVVNVSSTAAFPTSGTLCIRNDSTVEYVTYTGKSTTQFTGVTRAQAGTAAQTVTIASGANSGTVTANTGIQIGQRAIAAAFPEDTFVSSIAGTTIGFSQAATATNPSVIFAPMASTAQTFTYSATGPAVVEYAYPNFGAALNHWGTSVIMDGRFDDDKSLVFTYGQTTFTNIAAGTSKALFSIRVAPSVDNGQTGPFGARELINRLQLTLKALGITTKTAGANMLVRAYLNAVPSGTTSWTNAVGNVPSAVNSSLAQIADYAGGTTTVTGGEITAGFLVAGTDRLDLLDVRDLGNSILGGGGATSNVQIYPDGPDVLTIIVTNLGTAAIDVLGRLSWTEAQA